MHLPHKATVLTIVAFSSQETQKNPQREALQHRVPKMRNIGTNIRK